jgi:hypothetical protein
MKIKVLIMNDNFAAFILTHGRAHNVKTFKTLREHGYKGKIYLIVDDQDNQKDEYKKIYGKQVIIFNKMTAASITDAGDNFMQLNSVLYARNASFEIAKKLELKYFWQLDDDYTTFNYTADENCKYLSTRPAIKNLDKLLEYIIEFLEVSGFTSLAFSQGGDFIGGEGSGVFQTFKKGKIPRKAMNSFLFCVDRPIKFLGRMNDDVNTYIVNGNKGKLFGTIVQPRLEQANTQSQEGGMTEAYLHSGTYVKSFYSVLFCPSGVTINLMGNKNKRLHHKIHWNNVVPNIISQNYKKECKQ